MLGLAKLISKLGIIRIFGKSQKLESELQKAGWAGVDGSKFASGAALISMFPAFAVVFLAFLIGLSIQEMVGFGLLSFGIVFAFLYFLPALFARRRLATIEAELPFLLREAAICIDIGIPFEKCIDKLSKRDYAISSELAAAHLQIRSGASVQAALMQVAARLGSMQVKRCFMLMCSLYETGAKSEPLKQLASELSASQMAQLRLQAGRASLLLIFFIASSALLPSFFTVFAAILPSAGEAVPSWAIYVSFLFVFPAINTIPLFLIAMNMPSFRQQKSVLESYLKSIGIKLSHRSLVVALFAFLTAASLIALQYSLTAAAIIFLLAPTVYGLASFLAHRQIAQAEAFLPDALYSAASAHRLLSPEKLLSFLSKGGFGMLSEAFEIALRRQKAGESFAASLEAAFNHCPSLLVRRATALLVLSYETGADMYFALRETAQDIASFFSLVAERSAQLSIQRYTVLAASGLLVPAILGSTISLAPLLAIQDKESFEPIAVSCPIYLALNAAFSALSLGLSEGNLRKAGLYFAFMAPASQLVFAVFSGEPSTLLLNPSLQIA
ncbi:MAG: type II secretion system F family protein [Candidatus Anstonellaceae archaeon]